MHSITVLKDLSSKSVSVINDEISISLIDYHISHSQKAKKLVIMHFDRDEFVIEDFFNINQKLIIPLISSFNTEHYLIESEGGAVLYQSTFEDQQRLDLTKRTVEYLEYVIKECNNLEKVKNPVRKNDTLQKIIKDANEYKSLATNDETVPLEKLDALVESFLEIRKEKKRPKAKPKSDKITKVIISGMSCKIDIIFREGEYVKNINISGMDVTDTYYTDSKLDLVMSGMDNKVTIKGLSIINKNNSGMSNKIKQIE